MTRDDLERACWDIRQELQQRRKRSLDERRRLVQDVEQLLQVLHTLLHEGPGDPAYRTRHHGHSIDVAFWERYQRDLGNIRTMALMRAAVLVFGTDQAGRAWTSDGPSGEASWYLLAHRSDEGLKRGLEALEARRCGKPSP